MIDDDFVPKMADLNGHVTNGVNNDMETEPEFRQRENFEVVNPTEDDLKALCLSNIVIIPMERLKSGKCQEKNRIIQ